MKLFALIITVFSHTAAGQHRADNYVVDFNLSKSDCHQEQTDFHWTNGKTPIYYVVTCQPQK